MPKISVIVPVYGAEKTLVKCVESLVYGEERDLEILLIEDCSKDGSWALCQELAQEFPQVKIFRNEENRGVSATRNRGLEQATGEYILFVDSDDWVRGDYARVLLEATQTNPGSLVVCGYTFIDHTQQLRHIYGLPQGKLPKRRFFRLSEEILLQQLWNKIFIRSVIEKAKIRFDESISMGEDHQFVLDYIRASGVEECLLVGQPLYYYIRWNSGSLMSHWGKLSNFEKTLSRVEQLRELTGDNLSANNQLRAIRQQYVHILRDNSTMSNREKHREMEKIMGSDPIPSSHGQARASLGRLRRILRRRWERLANGVRFRLASGKIKAARKKFRCKDRTIISQNCIGGVFSHDMKEQFRSPTVNLYFSAEDFLKLVENLEDYLKLELVGGPFEEHPVGMLGDLKVHFVHYSTFREAREAWNRRLQRVDLEKILVLSTDRDGFSPALFQRWQAIAYPKVLFTADRQYADHPDSVYFPKYAGEGCVGDLIPKREFYKNGKLLSTVNGGSQ